MTVDQITEILQRLARIETHGKYIMQEQQNAAARRRELYQKVEQVEDNVEVVKHDVGSVSRACEAIGSRVELIEVWRSARDGERHLATGRDQALREVSARNWLIIGAVATPVGGGLAALGLELIKRWL